MTDVIKKYYVLCSIVDPVKKHIVTNIIGTERQKYIISENELSVFMKTKDSVYTVNESIIGGANDNKVRKCATIYCLE